MTDAPDSRILVVAGATTLSVSLALGDTQVSVKAPNPRSSAQLSEDQLRAAALRVARRALEVAIEEIASQG